MNIFWLWRHSAPTPSAPCPLSAKHRTESRRLGWIITIVKNSEQQHRIEPNRTNVRVNNDSSMHVWKFSIYFLLALVSGACCGTSSTASPLARCTHYHAIAAQECWHWQTQEFWIYTAASCVATRIRIRKSVVAILYFTDDGWVIMRMGRPMCVFVSFIIECSTGDGWGAILK